MVKYPETLNAVFAALADPTRRAILEELAKGHSTVSELAEPHDMSLPAISKHLRVLEEAGLITRTVEGRIHYLQLNSKPMSEVLAWLELYRKFWEQRFDALEKYLTSSKKR
jgi:DNA-binding transcriptional ArsR family regulator